MSQRTQNQAKGQSLQSKEQEQNCQQNNILGLNQHAQNLPPQKKVQGLSFIESAKIINAEKLLSNKNLQKSSLNDDNRSQRSRGSEASSRPHRKSSFLSQEQEEQILLQKKKADERAVFVENVDYKATKQQLELLFEDCGQIQRVTILKNNFNGQPKGCAYVSFLNESSVERALALTGVTLRFRVLRVQRKRTNLPGVKKERPPGEMKLNFLEMMQNYNSKRGRGRGRGRGRDA